MLFPHPWWSIKQSSNIGVANPIISIGFEEVKVSVP